MDGASGVDDATAMLASLQEGGSAGIYRRVLSFLLPFGDVIHLGSDGPPGAPNRKDTTAAATKKKGKSASAAASKRRSMKEEGEASGVLRPLAKRFLTFISRALKLLPSSLRQCPREEEERAGELFAVYRLVLDCLACIAPCLEGKPSSILLQRCTLIGCLETWGKYEEATEEGIHILESLRSMVSLAAPKKPQKGTTAKGASGGGLLPDSAAEGANDADLAMVVVKVVASLLKCAYKSKTKNDAVHRRILLMAAEVQPWLRLLDSEAFEKCHYVLVDALCKCSLFLAGECMSFDADLVCSFCLTMLKELLQSSSKDLFPKIARQVCSSVCLQWENRALLMFEMLRCSLDSISCRCQVNVAYMVNQLFEFVHYIVGNCQAVNLDAGRTVSELLYAWRSNLIKVSSPVASVLGIYAIAMDYVTRNVHLQHGQRSNDAAVELLNGMNHLQIFADSLDVLRYYFHSSSGPTCGVLDKCAKRVSSLSLECKTSRSCDQAHGEVSMLSYVDALGFLCIHLEEYANNAWKHMISENKCFISADIDHVHNALSQYCDFFLHEIRCNEQAESDMFHRNRAIVMRAAVVSLKISLGLSENDQAYFVMVTSIDQLVSCQWIEPHELKYLASSFYVVGVSLYNVGKVKKASIALRLCCRTLWTHVRKLCQLFSDKSPIIYDGNLSEDAIKDAITDLCEKCAVSLDVIHRCGETDLHIIVVNSLLRWSAADELLETSASPFLLVKQWAKIICKDFNDANVVDSVPVLYSLLSSKCKELSKRALHVILEQELSSYEELEVRYPKLCKRLQIKLIDILMDIYATEGNLLSRSMILVKKGQTLRACGLDSLNSSFQCLSEALSLLETMRNDAGDDIIVHYQLALAYSLHAHCAQETNQKTEIILHDIGSALDSWSRIYKATNLELENEKTIQLLCNIADLAGLKGHLDFQLQLCKLILLFGKRMDIPIERCVDVLWSNRRISHAFCSSPIDANFIVDVSEELGIHANLTSFWMSCMESSPSSLVGFLQIFLLPDSMLPQMSHLSSKGSFGSHVTVEEVKKVALSLVSSVPVSSHSAFAAGYLFFDLSQRLLLVGQLLEALTYAREALDLRTNILRRKFIYLLGKQPGKLETTWDNNQPFGGSIGSVLTKEWPTMSGSQSLESCIISPWSVLKCYLESILQVGLIYESTGNGVEAEKLFRTGKSFSCSLGFPVLGIAFSSHLGQVYRKKQLLKLAEDELDVAKKILLDNENIISCNHCKVALHGTIDLQVGDLYRSIFETTSRIRSTDILSNALSLYQSAIEKLKCAEVIDKCYSDIAPLASQERGSMLLDTSAQTSGCIGGSSDGQHLRDHLAVSSSRTEKKGANVRVVSRKNFKSASCDPSRKQNVADQSNLIDCKNQIHRHSKECMKKCHILECTNSIQKATCQDICHPEGKLLGPGNEPKQICRCNEASTDCKPNCWKCFLANVMETGSMHKIICVKWECHRRCLLLKLLTEIGNCMGILCEIHEVHEILWQSMSLLFNTELLCQTGTHSPSLLEFVGMENRCDIFPIQRAELLYNMGLFCAKECLSEGSRTCCALSRIQIPVVLSWLLLAFILAQEIPSLFQQVSRLIATILLLSMSTGNLSLPFSFQSLNGSQLAAFFHQASVGTYLQHMYISNTKDKGSNTKDLQTGDLTDRIASSNYFRVAPAKLSDLEEFVNNFFQSLPSFTVICISLLGGDYINLLSETLLLPSFFPAWMLLSRLHCKEQPIVMLLPVDFPNQGDASDSLMPASEDKESATKWECPWGYTLMDYVAPEYKMILEENFLTLSGGRNDVMDEKKRRSMWWSERTKLNNRLSRFLRTIEDSWLGPWRCLLLGGCSDFKHLDAEVCRLSHSLKFECRAEASMSLLKAILYGGQSLSDIKACISQLLLYKGYLGRGGCCRADSFRAFSPAIDGGSESLSESTCKLIQDAVGKLVQESLGREPVVLVLDADLQMLPWENIPILRKQEVYRMPSMGSISAALDRHWHREEAKGFDAFIPSVDPLDAYYLLNPSGDLGSTQVEFEDWFVNQKWEGKAGEAPTPEELADALQKHDLFLYFGHGSGMQYISGRAIQKLDRCASGLLMGCSSGSLSLRGPYAPQGASLSYLLAGSPALIANLWDVSDKDIDRFGKAMLNSWLQERSTVRCTRCNSVVEECECLDVDVGNSRSVRTRSRVSRDEKLKNESRRSVRRKSGTRIASFMSQARDTCKLPILIGAAPVCYGVPTLIRNSKC